MSRTHPFSADAVGCRRVLQCAGRSNSSCVPPSVAAASFWCGATDCGIVPLGLLSLLFSRPLMVDLAPLLAVRASPLRCVQPTVRLGVGEVGLPLTIWPLGSPHQTVWTN